MTTPPSTTDALQIEAWDGALNTFGTAYVFGWRAGRFKTRLKWMAFIGIALPLAVGAVALAGVTTGLGVVVLVGGLLGVPVTVMSGWSLAANWSGNLAAATQSETTNYQLHDEYETLAQRPPADETQFRHALDLITARDRAQRDRDRDQHVTRQEIRMGMRAALRKRRKSCAGCSLVPTDMTPTNCGVCGDFPKRWQR